MHARKLALAEESAIRALAATKSLRLLATDVGVSHETIRAVLRNPMGIEGDSLWPRGARPVRPRRPPPELTRHRPG